MKRSASFWRRWLDMQDRHSAFLGVRFWFAVYSGLAAGLAVVLVSGESIAFCRTTTCDPSSADCQVDPETECPTLGIPLYWPARCVGYSLQQDATRSVPFDIFQDISERSFESWLTADCGSGDTPNMTASNLGSILCDATEYNRYAGNANIIMFRSDTWPYKSALNTLALTTVTYNRNDGQIYDVDIEINATVALTTSLDHVTYDVESILTHEVGHFFGMAHSNDRSATMFAQYAMGSVSLRSLELDDISGICDIYPPSSKTRKCSPLPHGGLKNSCGDSDRPESNNCTCSAIPPQKAPWKLMPLFSIFAWFAMRRIRGTRLSLS